MEIRLTASGSSPLATKTFFSDEKGFEVASVMVMGKSDAVLIDAQWTLSNAHRVITEILETGNNVCRKTVKVEALAKDYIELEGQRLEIMSKVMGDMKYNTMVWIPSVKTLYASDVLFNQAHPFTCELTAEEGKQWTVDT